MFSTEGAGGQSSEGRGLDRPQASLRRAPCGGIYDRAVADAQMMWELAVANAGMHDLQPEVLFLDGEPVGGPTEAWGVWLMPEAEATRTPEFPLTASQIADLNSPEKIKRYRVIGFADADDGVVLGYLRHELEHVRQFQVSPPALWLNQLTMYALGPALGDLRGTGRIYNLMPRELDANGAARHAIFAWNPQEAARLRSTIFASLVRYDVTPDPGTMFFRSFCFAFLFADAVQAEFASRGEPLDDFLRNQNPEFLLAWSVLTNDARLSTLIAQARQAHPDAAAVAARGGRPGDAWESAADLYTKAYRRALKLLDFPTD